uniref:F-box domain-containing protein n=1 Tax=Steinernema glaseri TaxID=37863 RepID=A0A1I7Z2C6_9BILA
MDAVPFLFVDRVLELAVFDRNLLEGEQLDSVLWSETTTMIKKSWMRYEMRLWIISPDEVYYDIASCGDLNRTTYTRVSMEYPFFPGRYSDISLVSSCHTSDNPYKRKMRIDELATHLRAVFKVCPLRTIRWHRPKEDSHWLVAILPSLPPSVRVVIASNETPHLLKLLTEGLNRHQLHSVELQGLWSRDVRPLLIEHCAPPGLQRVNWPPCRDFDEFVESATMLMELWKRDRSPINAHFSRITFPNRLPTEQISALWPEKYPLKLAIGLSQEIHLRRLPSENFFSTIQVTNCVTIVDLVGNDCRNVHKYLEYFLPQVKRAE